MVGTSRSRLRLDIDCASSTQQISKSSSDLIESAVWSCSPWKMMMPFFLVALPPSRLISVWVTSNRCPTPKSRILFSSSFLAENLSDFWISRTQTACVVGSYMHRSISASAKKCDLPDERPPFAPFNRLGGISGKHHLGVFIWRVDDDTLNFAYGFTVWGYINVLLLAESSAGLEPKDNGWRIAWFGLIE